MDANRLLSALLNDEVTHVLDVGSRPLGEQASPEAYAASDRSERRCPYDDSRAATGKPINMAALAQVGRGWPELLGRLGQHVAMRVEPGRGASVYEAWCVSSDAILLPAYEWLRSGVDDWRASDPIAALYKASLGFSLVFPALLVDGRAAARDSLTEAFTPSTFFEVLDNEGWLIGTHQVCAGSRSMIEAYFERLCRVPASRNEALPDAFLRFAHLGRELFALATTWMALTRALVARGQLAEAPGWGGRPDRIDRTGWPSCVRIYEASPSRFVEMVRSRPGVGVQEIGRLNPQPEIPASMRRLLARVDVPSQQPFRRLDGAFVASAAPLLGDIMATLGQSDAPPLDRLDL